MQIILIQVFLQFDERIYEEKKNIKKLSQTAFQFLSLILCRTGHCSIPFSQEFKGVFARSKNNQEKSIRGTAQTQISIYLHVDCQKSVKKESG